MGKFIGDKIPVLSIGIDIINIVLRPVASVILFMIAATSSDVSTNILVYVLAVIFGCITLIIHLIKFMFRVFIQLVTLANPVGSLGVSLIFDLIGLMLILSVVLLPPLIIAGFVFLIYLFGSRVLLRYQNMNRQSQIIDFARPTLNPRLSLTTPT